jgi:hypothetical protein
MYNPYLLCLPGLSALQPPIPHIKPILWSENLESHRPSAPHPKTSARGTRDVTAPAAWSQQGPKLKWPNISPTLLEKSDPATATVTLEDPSNRCAHGSRESPDRTIQQLERT